LFIYFTVAYRVVVVAGSYIQAGDIDEAPELGCYGRFLFWMATLLSCCTITDWDKATKASMWRSRITLMLLYLLVLVVTGIVMYASYGGYEKLTVLDDQGTALSFIPNQPIKNSYRLLLCLWHSCVIVEFVHLFM
jgi:hypothetical protein